MKTKRKTGRARTRVSFLLPVVDLLIAKRERKRGRALVPPTSLSVLTPIQVSGQRETDR